MKSEVHDWATGFRSRSLAWSRSPVVRTGIGLVQDGWLCEDLVAFALRRSKRLALPVERLPVGTAAERPNPFPRTRPPDWYHRRRAGCSKRATSSRDRFGTFTVGAATDAAGRAVANRAAAMSTAQRLRGRSRPVRPAPLHSPGNGKGNVAIYRRVPDAIAAGRKLNVSGINAHHRTPSRAWRQQVAETLEISESWDTVQPAACLSQQVIVA
jgi:hypothetical protein